MRRLKSRSSVMIRFLCTGFLLAGLSSLGLTPTGCTSQDNAAQPVSSVSPTSPQDSGGGASQEGARDPGAGTGADSAVALKIPAPGPADEDPVFAANAFPPVLPDTERHQRAWLRDDCLNCHETGVEAAPIVVHADLPSILLGAKCRTCHVLIPGTPVPPKAPPTPEEEQFAVNAFPPMIPASGSHSQAWVRDDCMLCHEDGTHGAPILKHEGLPRLLLQAKCRTCHVQVRAVEASEPADLR